MKSGNRQACESIAHQQAFNHQKAFLFRWQPDGHIICADEACNRLFQQISNQAVENFFDCISVDDRTRLIHIIESLTPELPFFDWVHPIYQKQKILYWQHNGEGIFDDQGHLIEIRSAAWDISTQEETESALYESELRQSTLLNALPDLVFIINREGVYIDCYAPNPEDLIIREDEMIGKVVHELLPPDIAMLISNAYETVFQTGEMQVVDYPLMIGNETKFFTAYIVPYGNDRLLSIIRNVTEVNRTLEKLKQTEIRYQSIFDGIRDGILVEDNDGRIIDVNLAACQMFGYTREQFLEKSVYDIATPEHIIVVNQDLSQLVSNIPEHAVEVINIRSNGERFPAEITARIHPIGENTAAIVVVRDITERKKQEEELQRLSTAMQITSDAMLITDSQGIIIEVNQALLNLVGAKSANEINGKQVLRLIPLRDRKKALKNILQLTQPEPLFDNEVNILTRDGHQTIPVEISLTAMENNGKQPAGYVLILRDITRRKEHENKLQRLCSFDVLTGLANRYAFEEEINRLENSNSYPVCIIMLDTDGLKYINDNLGHSKGDELLYKVAHILKQSFRESDFIARIGGDEFVVIMTRTEKSVMKQAVRRLKQNILEADRENPDYRISISIGGYCALEGTYLHDALFHADEMMYQEKEKYRRKNKPQ